MEAVKPAQGHRSELGLLGVGGHGTDIAATVTQTCGYDDHHPDYPDLADFDGGDYLIGVNDCRQRRNIAERMERAGHRTRGVWVHRDASVGPRVTLGRHTHINAGATITRTTIGEFCTISPGANICGDVKIGDLVTIGAGATVCQFVTIGDGATIGAGATVLPHTIIPPGETWVGTPARPIR